MLARKEREKSKQKTLKQKIIKGILRTFFVLFVILLAAGVGIAGVGAGYIAAVAKHEQVLTKEDFDQHLSNWSETTYAYFRPTDGKPQFIGQLQNADDRQLVRDIKDVSPYLLDAFIATEDREFYKHNGISPRSIARAAYQQVQQLMGKDVQATGGSTLTQQLVRSEILDDRSKTSDRKIREIIQAIHLEKYYSKPEILIKYLNSTYFGISANHKHMYGVVAAAKGIFNKDVKDLSLPQAAYIAGMVQRPNAYTPFGKNGEENLKRGTKRMKLVLKNMLITGKITKKQYQEAIQFDVKKSLAKPEDFKEINAYENYPFVITAVENEATDILQELYQDDPNFKGKNRKFFRNMAKSSGLKIYTTIDKKLYDEMNKVAQTLSFNTTEYDGKEISEQIGASLINNQTGEILAFVSGTKFDEESEDHAFEAKNQPGSTMKPLLAYGPAMNEGMISPDSSIVDEPLKKRWSDDYYRNSSNKFHGKVTATQALQHSYNIPAIKVYRELGKERAFKYLPMMGLEPDKHDGEPLVLGGATEGFTVNEMTAAYAMIANYGKYNKPHIIDRIEDSTGKLIYDYKEHNQAKQVFRPEVAYALTEMLRQVVTSGTAQGTISPYTSGYNVAGKTGTTTSENDLWFIGFTPEVTLGVWAGYDYNMTGNKYLAKEAWAKLFQTAANTAPGTIPKGTSFTNPGGYVPYKCFECHRVVLPPADEKKKEQQKKAPVNRR